MAIDSYRLRTGKVGEAFSVIVHGVIRTVGESQHKREGKRQQSRDTGATKREEAQCVCVCVCGIHTNHNVSAKGENGNFGDRTVGRQRQSTILPPPTTSRRPPPSFVALDHKSRHPPSLSPWITRTGFLSSSDGRRRGPSYHCLPACPLCRCEVGILNLGLFLLSLQLSDGWILCDLTMETPRRSDRSYKTLAVGHTVLPQSATTATVLSFFLPLLPHNGALHA